MKIDLKHQGWWFLQGFDLKTGRELWRESIHNGIPTAAANDTLSTYFSGNWYIGLIAAAMVEDPTDTMGSHAGWSEYTGYTEGTRPAWNKGSPSGGQISNTSSKAQFTVPAGPVLTGAFLVNDSTKGGSSNLLWATGKFLTQQSIGTPQVVQAVYSLRFLSG